MKRAIPIAGLLLLAVSAVEVYAIRHRIFDVDASPELIAELRERLEALPTELDEGAYRPEKYELDPEVVEQSGADVFVARGYRDEAGGIYRVYIGGAIRNRESFHAPNYCMPAAGWEILSQEKVPSPMADQDASLMRLNLRKGEARMLVYYWFQCGRRQTHHDLLARLYRFFDFVAAAFDFFENHPVQPTMISTIYVPYSGAAEDADARARRFMTAIRPALLRAVDPQEN